MVESEAKGLSEEVMLGAVLFGHEQMQTAIAAINKLAAEAGKPRWDWKAGRARTSRSSRQSPSWPRRTTPRPTASSSSRRASRASPRSARLRRPRLSGGEKPQFTKDQVTTELHDLEYRLVRDMILSGKPRIDGRDLKTVRPISVEVGALPRTHGSAIFTRGETQALVTTTLGTGRDAQIIDALAGERREPFMLHYNFPPFSVGETGFMGSPKRREIGHGNLARRGIRAVMPDLETLPVRAARRVRGPRVERLELDGERLRHQPRR